MSSQKADVDSKPVKVISGCGILSAFIFAIVLLAAASGCCMLMWLAVKDSNIATGGGKGEAPKQIQSDASKFIPGLRPVDVYLNFTNKGFSLRKEFSDEANFWFCEDSTAARLKSSQTITPPS